MKHIFIINGYPFSGKTTFEKMVSKYIPTYITSTVTEVKAMVDELYGKSEKNEERRKLLSDTKRELVNNGGLIEKLTKLKIKLFLESDKQIMFIDSREVKEIKEFKDKFDATTIFIKNDRVSKVISNPSDNNVENMEYDRIIENNGTLEELEQKAKDFVIQLNNNII